MRESKKQKHYTKAERANYCEAFKESGLSAELFCKEIKMQSIEVMPESWRHAVESGRQIFLGEHSMDGFYYCILTKLV